MRSIAGVTVWEFGRRCWGPCLPLLMGSISLPALVYGTLSIFGVLDEASLARLQFVFLAFSLFGFCFAVCSVQGIRAGVKLAATPVRLYHLPLPTSTIALGQLLCGMATMVLLYLATASVLNALYRVDWPLWGPALVFAMSYACVQATVWCTTRLGLVQFAAFCAVGAGLFFWIKSRFGPVLGEMEHAWRPLSPVEVGLVAGLTLVAAWAAVAGVAIDRRGGFQGWVMLRQWWDRQLRQMKGGPRQFGSAQRAQFWHEWRLKGWILPAPLLAGLLVVVIVRMFGAWDREQVVIALYFLGIFLVVLGAVAGLGLGQVNLSAGRPECGSFLATRPMTDSALAAVTMLVALASLVLSMAIWIVAMLAGSGWLLMFEGVTGLERAWREAFPTLDGRIMMLQVGGMLFAAWTGLAVLVPLTMTGRPRVYLSAYIAAPALVIAVMLTNKLLIPLTWQAEAQRLEAFALAIGTVLGVAAAVSTALLHGQLSPRMLALGLAGVVVPGMTLAVAIVWRAPEAPLLLTLTFALLALAISPLATAPLAMAWNRRR